MSAARDVTANLSVPCVQTGEGGIIGSGLDLVGHSSRCSGMSRTTNWPLMLPITIIVH